MSLLLALLLSLSHAADLPEPQLVEFPGGNSVLRGFLYRPPGPGPFPAILYNHGSEAKPGKKEEVAKFALDHGYVFFVPHRRGHGRSPGKPVGELQDEYRGSDPQGYMIQLQLMHGQDVDTALKFLTAQSFVDTKNVFMMGCSYGGIQTVLAARRGLPIRSAVAFAPGAMSWNGNQALHGLLADAVKAKTVPLFVLQAENDFNLGPSQTLGPLLAAAGPPNRSKIYPPVGTTHEEGHGKFCGKSPEIWGSDVLEFLRATAARSR